MKKFVFTAALLLSAGALATPPFEIPPGQNRGGQSESTAKANANANSAALAGAISANKNQNKNIANGGDGGDGGNALSGSLSASISKGGNATGGNATGGSSTATGTGGNSSSKSKVGDTTAVAGPSISDADVFNANKTKTGDQDTSTSVSVVGDTHDYSDLPVAQAAQAIGSECVDGASAQGRSIGISLGRTNPVCEHLMMAAKLRAVGDIKGSDRHLSTASRIANTRGIMRSVLTVISFGVF
jgi:hypothetical protein